MTRTMTILRVFGVLSLLSLLPNVASAQWHGPVAPDSLTFQGRLNMPNGTPVDSSLTMTFALYKGLNKVWEQTLDTVGVSDGVFSVILGGTGNASLDTVAFNEPMEVGIKVGNNAEMTPRTPLTASAYALGMRGMYATYKESNNWRSMNVIGGAANNRITGGTGNTIAGGGGNRGPGAFSGNTVGGDFNTISGGHHNTITGFDAVIAGGINNTVSIYDGVIGGGFGNLTEGVGAVISGGQYNTASGAWSVVGGGGWNRTLADYSTVAGGHTDTSAAIYSTVAGGYKNKASGLASLVGGGNENKASGDSSSVAGGRRNLASALATTVAGGSSNSATATYATVGGGRSNVASGERSTIGGGRSNEASGSRSTVAGGNFNLAGGSAAVGGGENNRAQGIFSTVPGGRLNWASGDYAFAAGYYARALHDGTFVWADAENKVTGGVAFPSTVANQFLIRAANGVGIGTNITHPGLTISRESQTAAYQLELRNVGSITGTNYDGIAFTQASGGTTELASIKVAYQNNGLPDLRFSVRNAANALVIETSSGDVGIGTLTPSDELEVNGGITAISVTETSDARMKRDVTPIHDAISAVVRLQGVTFEWDREHWPNKVLDSDRQIGLIAQDVLEVVPEVVERGQDGYYSVAYAKLVPLLIEAVKAQQEMIRQMRADNDSQRGLLEEYGARLAGLETRIMP